MPDHTDKCTDKMLQALFYRRSCPPTEQLGLYQLNMVAPSQRLVIAKHLRECPHCQRELAELAATPDQPSLLSKLRQAAGAIQAISPVPSQAHLSPVRGLAPSTQQYHAPGVDVLLSQQPGRTRGRRTIMGRLLFQEGETGAKQQAEVWLLSDADAWAAPVEARGVFRFDEVEPGAYQTGFEWQDRIILLDGPDVQ